MTWCATLTRIAALAPPIPTRHLGGSSLQQRINIADADLLRARDIYGVLAVYAPEARFRLDDGANQGSPGANYKNSLCAKPENPDPPDPTHSGQVLDPVIDWCNFPARLRQACARPPICA